jgi:hypothetical protein
MMAKRYLVAGRRFSSAALAILTAVALTLGITGSAIGLGVANAAPTRPVMAVAGYTNATSGSQLPVSVPATYKGTKGTASGTVPTFSTKSGKAQPLANLRFTTFTSSTGKVTKLSKAVTATDAMTSSSNSKTCKILNLILGPLHLNLLGLVVHLNKVHLTITAVKGPGNLLGNLLCAVANLLNGSGAVASKQGLLNDVVGALGILGQN